MTLLEELHAVIHTYRNRATHARWLAMTCKHKPAQVAHLRHEASRYDATCEALLEHVARIEGAGEAQLTLFPYFASGAGPAAMASTSGNNEGATR